MREPQHYITDGGRVHRVYRRWPRRMRNARYSPCRPSGQSFSIIPESRVSAEAPLTGSHWGGDREWLLTRANGPIVGSDAEKWKAAVWQRLVRGKSYNRGLWNTSRELMSRATRRSDISALLVDIYFAEPALPRTRLLPRRVGRACWSWR